MKTRTREEVIYRGYGAHGILPGTGITADFAMV